MFLFENFALKPLQIGEIMSNNKIMQFSYFYWNTNEKKADNKTALFHDGICRDCDTAFDCVMQYDCDIAWIRLLNCGL